MILFEILIGLSLTAILLVFLFSFLVENTKMEYKLQAARSSITQRSALQTRFQTILSAIAPGTLKVEYKDHQKSPIYTFLFDNGIDPDPVFSGLISAKIYLDKDEHLYLIYGPVGDEKDTPWRKELLLPQVTNFEFRFLAQISAKAEKEKIYPINHNYCWRTTWSQPTLPSMMRLIVKKPQDTIEFAFILPSVDPFVTYNENAL